MSRKMLFATTIALSSVLMSITANADETTSTTPAPTTTSTTTTTNPTSTTQSTQIPKETWLGSMMPLLPDLICKGFIQDADLKKRFDELKLTYDDCVKLIPESATLCKEKIYPSMPDQINDEAAGTWGRTLGECIGKDFAEKHLVPK